MDEKYSYIFQDGQIITYVNQDIEGAKTFNDGNAVDWTAYTYDAEKDCLVAKLVVVDPTTTVITPEPTAAEIEQQRKSVLDNMFVAKKNELIFNFGEATMDGDTTNAAKFSTDLKDLKTIYGNYTQEIAGGNDPFTIYGNEAFVLNGNGRLY